MFLLCLNLNSGFITFTFGRAGTEFLSSMHLDTVIKFAARGVYVMVALQVIFLFVFQMIGFDSLLLSITLVASVVVVVISLAVWRALKKAVRKQHHWHMK